MKKLSLLFLFIFSLSNTYSQNQKNYYELFRPQQEAIGQAFSDNNFDKAEKLIIKSIKDFTNNVPDGEKQYYKGIPSGNYYDLACIYSLKKKKKEALENLEKAVIDWDYKNYKHVMQDTDLDFIRKDKKFNDLFEKMRLKGDYILMLQQSGNYISEDKSNRLDFEYEDTNNGRIKSVKTYLKLDSIAGTGDEMSKIINIMTWLHNTVRHDGNHWPLCETDAIDIYNYNKATGKGVNCRALAIMLNECYLSMGFKSRFITCLPKDKNDNDCHVINVVWSKTYNKWIWMDPTFNAYVMDDKGNYLSIEEVRERLIKNLPVVINEDANWNNENKQTKEMYLDSYMAKNLYWLQCPAQSFFNIETTYRNSTAKYVSLLTPDYSINERERDFITNDHEYFWQAPKLD
ncbi:TPR end-of-group domain-containing protein [Dysgonomonas sp. ZJ279]|uniref:TPR end-of-group domain-containing protein n=1 Tax=Dysgonomonas sp. ZJ279 TaxID=2709796 RepID=UPI0013EA05F2|nr:transglutaminase domain-containing protein [Dysgonomonas sp. ZJ279]